MPADLYPPEHIANSLYLEWFSEANGRVAIESADYELTISAPEWRLSPQEETERAEQAAQGMANFMRRLSEAIEKQHRGQKDPEQEWDEHDYEKFLKESDARNRKYGELLDKYGDSEEARAKIAREMGWDRGDLSEEEQEAAQRSIDEMNAVCEAAADEPPPEPDPDREGIDWIRLQNGDVRHPLQHRCSESALKLHREAARLGFAELDDQDLDQFLGEFHTASIKLAGALNTIARGAGFTDAAFIVAWLKRALDHLHKSQSGLEAVASRRLLPESVVAEARQEQFQIREGILRLMDQFRGRG